MSKVASKMNLIAGAFFVVEVVHLVVEVAGVLVAPGVAGALVDDSADEGVFVAGPVVDGGMVTTLASVGIAGTAVGLGVVEASLVLNVAPLVVVGVVAALVVVGVDVANVVDLSPPVPLTSVVFKVAKSAKILSEFKVWKKFRIT